MCVFCCVYTCACKEQLAKQRSWSVYVSLCARFTIFLQNMYLKTSWVPAIWNETSSIYSMSFLYSDLDEGDRQDLLWSRHQVRYTGHLSLGQFTKGVEYSFTNSIAVSWISIPMSFQLKTKVPFLFMYRLRCPYLYSRFRPKLIQPLDPYLLSI